MTWIFTRARTPRPAHRGWSSHSRTRRWLKVTDERLVETEYGFHILKLTDHKDAMTRTFEQVRPQLEDPIKSQKAQVEAGKRPTSWWANQAADHDTVARKESLPCPTPVCSRATSRSPAWVRPAPPGLRDGNGQSHKLQTQNSFVWITLVEVKPSACPRSRRGQDRDDVIRIKAVDVARRAAAMARRR